MPELTQKRAEILKEQIKNTFGHREFTGREFAPVAGLNSYHGTGHILASMTKRGMLEQTIHGYRLAQNGTAPQPQAAPVEAPTPEPAHSATVHPLLIKAGGYYIAGSSILIAGCHERDKVVLYTSIIEIDGATKLSRNKRIVFAKAQEPDEYAAVMAWLRANASEVDTTPEDAQAALQLAEEATAKLSEARKEIERLNSKLTKLREMFGE